MIKKLRTINNFGVFKDFKWNRNGQNLLDFDKKNIIYGWNYSGKTTLSRIFKSLNDSVIHVDYSGAQLEIELTDNSLIDNDNFADNEISCMIFNADYIKANLNWEPTESWNPIAFDVGENIDIRDEVESIDAKILRIEGDDVHVGRVKSHHDVSKDFSQYQTTKFTNQAKDIRQAVFNNTKPFNKGHLTAIVEQIKPNLDSHIISDEKDVQSLAKKSIASNVLLPIANLVFESKYQKIRRATKELLKEEPTKDQVIDALAKKQQLHSWVEDGLKFVENTKECSFCGNEVSSDRLSLLNAYFSNASQEVRERISKGKDVIESEMKGLDKIAFPKSANDFAESNRESLKLLLSEIDSTIDLCKKDLEHLKSELERKTDGNLFNSIELEEIEAHDSKINELITRFNVEIDSHNEFVNNFNTLQSEARDKLKKHFVAVYLRDEGYIEKEVNSAKANKWLTIYKSYVKRLKQLKQEKLDQLKDITKGKSELNDRIKQFLGREDIVVDVTEDDKFILNRNGYPAKNLSEGEKTAIAFSYFLIQLESKITDASISNTIVFIDDPISSLDNNHISQVYALINSFFFRKGLDPENENKVVNCFDQLFISTHNFELFSFLKDSNRLSRNKGARYYMIEKLASNESQIVNMPKTIMQYKSEYVHLFEVIYSYQNKSAEEKAALSILMPNALRRFLEIYTLMKIPSESSVESRVALLVDDVNQYKTLNHFSHFTTFEKMTKHDELIMNLPAAIGELFTLLEQDGVHYNSLLKAIGINQ